MTLRITVVVPYMNYEFNNCYPKHSTKRHFFCLDTKEMTKEKVKTDEKYG